MMSSFFPAQYSTLSAVALQHYLIGTYGLPASMVCRLLIRNVSDTYLLENESEKYIFKIYRDAHRNRGEIEGEVTLLNHLKMQGHSVAYPIVDQHGQQIQQFNAAEGFRNGILFSFAEGKVVQDLNKEQLTQFGKDLAALHQDTNALKIQHQRPVFNFETTLFAPLKTLKPHLHQHPEDYPYLEELTNKVVAKFEEFDTSSFSFGFCHYDFFPKNFHFDKEGKITFFDFDFAGEGYLVNDHMSFLNHYFFHVLNNRITREQADQDYQVFLTAYQSVRKLTEHELKAIPYLGICFHIFFLKFFYDNYDDWSSIFLTPAYTHHRIDLIRKWMDQYCNF